MANPRKFSEKIALHNQKQAEETAAFEAILREVSATTRAAATPAIPVQKHQHHLQLAQPNLGTYRGGSLPNVNQIANSSGIDLQGALLNLEDMKQGSGRQSLVDRIHRERSRQLSSHNRRSTPFDKRADCSPYGSAYLSPPPDTSWRRTNSDSALHTSAMTPQAATTAPTHRRDVIQQHMMDPGALIIGNEPFWESKKDSGQIRPKSCEVPGINIYPSPEQDSGVHIPISNNTGSLPDLTNLHFQSGLATPIDTEDQAYSQSPLEVNVGGHLTVDLNNFHLHHSSQQHHHHEQQHNQNIPQQHPNQHLLMPGMQYLQVPNHGSTVSRPLTNGNHSPTSHETLSSSKETNLSVLTSPTKKTLSTNIDSLSSSQIQGDLMTQYRSSTSDCPQSPTSPLSQHSYSPSQSPGLPPTTLGSSPFDVYYSQDVQQQAQTTALQHQFEQFHMMQDVTVTSNNNVHVYSMVSTPTTTSNLQFSQAATSIVTGSREFSPPIATVASNHYYSTSPQQPSSPQTPHSPQGPPSPTLQTNPAHQHQHQIPSSPTGHLHQQDPTFGFPPCTVSSINSHNTQGNNLIPDIILTGVDDHLSRQDLVKDISNAMAGMVDPFDSELFPTDDVLKDGLDPLDLDGLQMLTDPNMITDPATEDSFRLGL